MTLPDLRIGRNTLGAPYLLAPMAGLISAPFRGLCIAHGATAAPTELISATALAHRNRKTLAMIARAPEERWLWVQLFGADPGVMARAAEQAVDLGAQLIDVNMGCPVRKVTADGGGAAVMQDPPRAARIVEAIRSAVGDTIPVTAKIRAGWDSEHVNALEVGRLLEQVGVAALCLHPRTRAQRYGGQADWSLIAALKRAVRVPVIGNGDVTCVADANRLVEQTGCDAVMVGRGALGNPWIFEGLRRGQDVEPTPEERTAQVLEHLRRLHQETGDEARAVQRFRSRVIHYARGLDGGVEFRRSIVHIADLDGLREALATFFSTAQRARGFRVGREGALWTPGSDNQDAA
ncbi:MAG: tRNA dihydrouridine synthase DusB [Pseudomonadota bacterium]